jgi:hypothetical protein
MVVLMMPEDNTGHLQLCRQLYSQLRRIQAHQDHKESAASASLPINFPMFVRNFDLYLKWVERNSKVVEIAVRRPPVRAAGGGGPV